LPGFAVIVTAGIQKRSPGIRASLILAFAEKVKTKLIKRKKIFGT